MAPHSSTLAWKIPWAEESGWTRLSDFTFTFTRWRRKWQPTLAFLPGESQGWGSIPGTEEPGGLPSMGSHRAGHDWSDLAAAAPAAYPGDFLFDTAGEWVAIEASVTLLCVFSIGWSFTATFPLCLQEWQLVRVVGWMGKWELANMRKRIKTNQQKGEVKRILFSSETCDPLCSWVVHYIFVA